MIGIKNGKEKSCTFFCKKGQFMEHELKQFTENHKNCIVIIPNYAKFSKGKMKYVN